MSTLFKCARRDDLENLKKLVSNGANINELGFDNITPLHVAASRNSMRCLSFLMENNARIDAKTELFVFFVFIKTRLLC